MTNIELEAYRAHIRACLTISDKEIDWEQRRYELAKAAMTGIAAGDKVTYEADYIARRAVEFADALINELKAKKNE